MTTSRWIENPTGRPNIAAKEWEPRNGVDWSPTLCVDSDLNTLSELVDEHFATDASNSPLTSPATKTVVFSTPTPSSPVPPTSNDKQAVVRED